MNKTKQIALVGILGALSFIIMLVEIPFPVAAWLKFDVADVIALFGGLTGGYLISILIIIVKIVLNLLLHGSQTSGIGEFASLIASLTYILPIMFIYRKKQNIYISLVAGTIVMTVLMVIGNYYWITPFYAKLYQMTFITDMIARNDGSYLKYIVTFYGAFNLFKGIIVSVIYILIHKKFKNKYLVIPEKKVENKYYQVEA